MKSKDKDDILRINLFRLEEDAAEQARVLREWSDKLAKAEKNAKLAKRKLRLTKAELSKVIRSAPGKYGIYKVTDTSVEDAVVMLSQYKEDEAAHIDAEYNRDMLKSMVSSLHERGEQIGNEVKLHGQQYWARPKADPEDIRNLREEGGVEAMQRASRKAK